MSKTILVAGYGPGISTAVAEKFGAEGYAVALVARNEERLAAGVKALEAKGVKAAAFPTDLSDPAAARRLVGKVKESLGPVTVIHWNAYASTAGDLLTADSAEVTKALDVGVGSLLATVQAALPDLRNQKGSSAVLVTNGGLGLLLPKLDAMAVSWNAMGTALSAAAKGKLVGLLAEKLKDDGIYIGEVTVNAIVKGTAFDQGNGTLDPKEIASKFWSLYQGRSELRAQIG